MIRGTNRLVPLLFEPHRGALFAWGDDAGLAQLVLGGTPIENRLAELWASLDFANPGMFGGLTAVRETFAVPVERDGPRDDRKGPAARPAPRSAACPRAGELTMPDVTPGLERPPDPPGRKMRVRPDHRKSFASHRHHESLPASDLHGSVATFPARMEALMSSQQVVPPVTESSTDVTTHAGMDLWRVQLATGEVRVMSLDALDDAFQSGVITESTPVLPPGASAWTKLADAAGLDAGESANAANADGGNVPSVAPMAVNVAETTGNATPYFQSQSPYSLPDLDIDEMHDEAFKPRKGRVFAFLGLAVVLVGGLGFAATRLGGDIASSASNSLSATGAEKAAAAQPPPAAVDVNQAAPAKVLTDEQKAKLAEADKAREAAANARDAKRAKDRPAGPAKRGSREKTSQPFVNGGSKFDPLNGAL